MLIAEGTQRKHYIEVPVPSCRRHQHQLQLIGMDCTKPCWKYWCFYCTSYYDKFHFPFSFPSLFLAWSPSCFLFLFSVAQVYDNIDCHTWCCFSSCFNPHQHFIWPRPCLPFLLDFYSCWVSILLLISLSFLPVCFLPSSPDGLCCLHNG